MNRIDGKLIYKCLGFDKFDRIDIHFRKDIRRLIFGKELEKKNKIISVFLERQNFDI